MEYKTCKVCGLNLEVSRFRTRSENGKLRGECMSCQDKYWYNYTSERADRKKAKIEKLQREQETGLRSCLTCKQDKILNTHNYEKHSKNGNYRNVCMICLSERGTKYYNNLSDEERILRATKLKQDSKKYRKNNKEKERQRHKKYNSSETGKEKRRNRENQKLKNNPLYRLRNYMPIVLRQALRQYAINKNGRATFNNIFPYSVKELYDHLVSQFEPWMNWDNWKIYNPYLWDDNDSSTWQWNIDHIIPQNKLPFSSIEDENFKKCWALENLRPYSAKQNILDGDRYAEGTDNE